MIAKVGGIYNYEQLVHLNFFKASSIALRLAPCVPIMLIPPLIAF